MLLKICSLQNCRVCELSSLVRQCDNHNGTYYKYVCITANQSHTESNPNCNPTTKQQAIVYIQLNIVACRTYVFAPFVRLSVVIVTPLPSCELSIPRIAWLRVDKSSIDVSKLCITDLYRFRNFPSLFDWYNVYKQMLLLLWRPLKRFHFFHLNARLCMMHIILCGCFTTAGCATCSRKRVICIFVVSVVVKGVSTLRNFSQCCKCDDAFELCLHALCRVSLHISENAN